MVARTAWPGDASPRFNARVAGVLSLLTILTGLVAEEGISSGLVGRDPAHVVANIVAHADQIRLGFAIYMVEMIFSVATVALFYHLLRPVSRSLSLMGACLSLVGNAIKTTGRLFFVAPLFVVEPASFARTLGPESTQALAHLFLRLTDRAAEMGLVFFGVATLVKGYLILRSTFLPRILGAVGMVAGTGWLLFLSPPLGHRYFVVILGVALLGSMATILWLIVIGVDASKWEAQARRSSP